MTEKKTIRLVLPHWQGGVNPDYVFGAEVLSFIAPPSNKDETIKVTVNENFDKPLVKENGVDGKDMLLTQLAETEAILKLKEPDRVIVFGGDCSVSQAPFDYLSGKYGETLGILWLDAHPDIATPDYSSHEHEMVLGNIIGKGAPGFAEKMKHPIDVNRVMYGGLILDELRPMEKSVYDLKITVAAPDTLAQNSDEIIRWIEQNKISKLAVHLDLDVISPEDFRSVLPAKPYLKKEDFGAAVGELTLDQIVRILNDSNNAAEIVGLSIAEHMPWDAINLRRALSRISIFDEKVKI